MATRPRRCGTAATASSPEPAVPHPTARTHRDSPSSQPGPSRQEQAMSTHPAITPTCANHRRRWHDLGERGWADHAALEYPHGHRVALGEGGMRRSEVANLPHATRSATASCIKRHAVASAWLSGGDTPAAREVLPLARSGRHAAAPARSEARSPPGVAARKGGLPMRDDTVVTGQDGNGNKHAGVAEWSVAGYTELTALGSGGSGDVTLARHDASGTLVAIKYLRRTLLADPQWAELFRAEAQVLAYLDDPNIVRLYEYVESPSGAAIVMELVDGVSAREILTHQGGTTPEAALVVLQGSLLGLAAAHRRGIVHRDYKPENVLVDGNGDSKLTDFGIAARTGAEPVAAGSLMYAPPEQFAGTPASPAGDVYAATATFYECLTGRPPFTGDTAERLLYQHLTEPVPLDPVPEPLRPLVAAGMAKDPALRPTDGTALVAGLRTAAGQAYGPDWEQRGRSRLA